MKPIRTIAALAAGAALIWGSAQAAPEAPEAEAGIPVIILELQPIQPDGGGAAASEQEQAMMSMLLLQLLMGLQVQGEPAEAAPLAAPMTSGGQRI